MTERTGRLIGAVVAGTFLVLAVMGLVRILNVRSVLDSYARAEGTITEVDQTSDNGGLRFTPMIEYQTEDGELWRFESAVTRSERPPRGSTVEVLYDPDDPSDARENTFQSLWRGPLTMLVVGLAGFFGLLVFIIGRVGRRRHRAAVRQSAKVEEEPPHDPIVADFSHVQPRGPDDDGKFQYRIVAVIRTDGVKHTFYSDWLEENPTVEIMAAGNKLLVIPDDEGSGRVIPPPA